MLENPSEIVRLWSEASLEQQLAFIAALVGMRVLFDFQQLLSGLLLGAAIVSAFGVTIVGLYLQASSSLFGPFLAALGFVLSVLSMLMAPQISRMRTVSGSRWMVTAFIVVMSLILVRDAITIRAVFIASDTIALELEQGQDTWRHNEEARRTAQTGLNAAMQDWREARAEHAAKLDARNAEAARGGCGQSCRALEQEAIQLAQARDQALQLTEMQQAELERLSALTDERPAAAEFNINQWGAAFRAAWRQMFYGAPPAEGLPIPPKIFLFGYDSGFNWDDFNAVLWSLAIDLCLPLAAWFCLPHLYRDPNGWLFSFGKWQSRTAWGKARAARLELAETNRKLAQAHSDLQTADSRAKAKYAQELHTFRSIALGEGEEAAGETDDLSDLMPSAGAGAAANGAAPPEDDPRASFLTRETPAGSA